MTALYGIIGRPLEHSFSPAYFNDKFRKQGIDARYEKFELAAIDEFPALLQNNPQLGGLNVTIPYKESVLAYLDELDPVTTAVGAVNCIRISNGKTKGYNTDIIGFRESLLPLLQPQHTKALVLGTGGASKAVLHVLDEAGINYTSISRSPDGRQLTYADLTSDIITAHKLIINTTPLGMHPHINQSPQLPYEAIGTQHLLYDLIYNPAETKFLSLGRQQGAVIKNGLEMLHLQAEAAWRIWHGR
jgi:shikimate dehydrogenase